MSPVSSPARTGWLRAEQEGHDQVGQNTVSSGPGTDPPPAMMLSLHLDFSLSR